MKNKGGRKKNGRGKFVWYFSLFILALMVACSLIALGIYYLLGIAGVIERENISTIGIIASILVSCGIIGALIAGLISRAYVTPVEESVDAINRLAHGDYDVHLETGRSENQVKSLREAINKTAAELGNTEVMRSDFINTVSHEYKTPVASILGYAKILKNSPLDEKQEKYVDIILEEAHNLASMTTNVLLLSRFENTEIVTDKKPYSLDEQLRRCFVQLQSFWQGKDISISGSFSAVTYFGNEELMQHIWSNIVKNAIKFTDRGGEISCSVEQVGENAVVRVKDNGCGMDKETQERIFDKFYQKEGSGKTEGNGLGLAIVKRAVDLCGGKVMVESEPDLGTEFIVILPNEYATGQT